MIKNLPPKQVTLVQLKRMATHSSILAWRIPGTEETGGVQSIGNKESDTTETLSMKEH